jgi:chlorobactene glucosyltransferase
MDVVLVFVSGALVVIALQTVLNSVVLPRLRPAPVPSPVPMVSLLVPARNEARVIAQTVTSLLAQDYPHFELIVLDDNSTDDTRTLAQRAGKDDPRLTLISGQALPSGWLGKNWACHQLAQAAQGDILLFTDADTQWHSQALRAIVAHMTRANVDLYTVWSTQKTHSWAERLVVPLMAFVIMGYLPILLTHFSPFAIFAAANGQCMAWRRQAYARIGGHERVAGNVLDDVTLARIAKSEGLTLRMADANGLITCRMYDSWRDVRNGYAKNILAGYGNSVLALLLASVFHWALFLLPILWLFLPSYAWAGLLCLSLGVLARALTAHVTHQRPLDALLMPISVLLMTRIAVQALVWHWRGGAQWKGRTLHQHAPQT